MCCSFFSRKNHSFLIDAFSILKKEYPTLKLICVGGGELLDYIKQKTQEFGLTSSVTFTGYVNDVSCFLQDSKYFVLTSKHEGNPISILEAYHFGLPVISSSVGGIPDVVTSKTGILFESNSINSFIDSFKKITLSNYEELSKNCVIVSEEYSISKCASQYLDYFRKSRAYFESTKIEK